MPLAEGLYEHPRQIEQLCVTGDQVTEILVVGGERFHVQGAPDEVKSRIVDAARGSILELVSLAEAESGELIALNPAHIVAVSSRARRT